jgi:MoaA/NifB/PqqE/SkfB family radical SAM enzyme
MATDTNIIITGKKVPQTGARQQAISAKHVLKLPAYLASGIKYHAAGKLYTPKPLHSTLTVTRRCNSRCIMCIYWKEHDGAPELSPAEIRDIFKDPVFSSLEYLTLSGGEATLRGDLLEITRTITEICPGIRNLALISNGLDTKKVIKQAQSILEYAQTKNIDFAVSISLDGLGDLHEQIRGIPQAFNKVRATLTELQQLQHTHPFYLSLNCVVQPLNFVHLEAVAAFAAAMGMPLTFSPICTSNVFTDNQGSITRLQFSPSQLAQLKTLVDNNLQPYLSPSNAPFWQEYFQVLQGKKRRIPCFILNYFVNVDSDGSLRMCAADDSLVYGNVKNASPGKIWFSKESALLRKRAKRQYCDHCTIHCDIAKSLTLEFFYFTGYLLGKPWRQLFGIK